jgi:hypothetical protein
MVAKLTVLLQNIATAVGKPSAPKRPYAAKGCANRIRIGTYAEAQVDLPLKPSPLYSQLPAVRGRDAGDSPVVVGCPEPNCPGIHGHCRRERCAEQPLDVVRTLLQLCDVEKVYGPQQSSYSSDRCVIGKNMVKSPLIAHR